MSTDPGEEFVENQPTLAEPDRPSEGVEDFVPEEATPEKSLAQTVQRLEAENKELKDRLLRQQAEFENARKRAQREKEEFQQYTLFNTVKSMLPVLDGFDLALENGGGGGEEYRKGVDLICRQLHDLLQKLGLEPIDAEGKAFDPHLHEAVATIVTLEHPENQIVGELQRGYLFKKRLLRPAMVRVAKRPATEEGTS